MLGSPTHAYRFGIGGAHAVEALRDAARRRRSHGNIFLKRVAVVRPGQGLGTAFLSLVLDEAFGPLGANRFHLDCFADNAPLKPHTRSWASPGTGSCARPYRLADGTRTDLVMMAVLKSEWEALTAQREDP